MSESVEQFYDDLASDYHQIYSDWDAAIDRQGCALDRLIQRELESIPAKLLDCSCGIGTQALGLAQLGYSVWASDLSSKAAARARIEAANRELEIHFAVADDQRPSNLPPDDN